MNTSSVNVMLVEDNQADARLIREYLNRSHGRFSLTHVTALQQGLDTLAIQEFAAILLDLSLPDSQGINTFTTLHQQANDTPIIVLTGLDDGDLAEQAINLGAQDYVLKGEFSPSVLARSIAYAINRQHLLSELRQSRTELQTSEGRLRRIISTNADGILVIDQKTNVIQFANATALKLFNRASPDLVGHIFEYPIIIGKNSELEITYDNNHGPALVAEMRVVSIDWRGQPAYLASLRDITERKMMEYELLRTSNDLAERNTELDQFAHTVAHQVRNLLGQIMGYASFLETEPGLGLPADAIFGLSRILNTGKKMDNVISELLLLSTIRREEVLGVPIEMDRCVDEASRRLSTIIKEQNGEIILPQNWPVAIGRATWIEEVWVNYIGNGLKYGGPNPRLELGADTLENDIIRFWVKDYGPGISPKDQEKIFLPHERLSQIHINGTGLGLSIVKRIVQKCNGEAGVFSQPGQGSTFWFTLPAANKDSAGYYL